MSLYDGMTFIVVDVSACSQHGSIGSSQAKDRLGMENSYQPGGASPSYDANLCLALVLTLALTCGPGHALDLGPGTDPYPDVDSECNCCRRATNCKPAP